MPSSPRAVEQIGVGADDDTMAMGKGGCSAELPKAELFPPASDDTSVSDDGSEVCVLEKERSQKIDKSPNFYWDDDLEPHRRR